jgi:peptidoglycan/xylan/chitin deacetylase (PgdA/CDA1 family)
MKLKYIKDILKTENVRATFFVIGKMALGAPELVKRERVEGHQIGNHTFSHDYKYIYEKPENFIEDINKSSGT